MQELFQCRQIPGRDGRFPHDLPVQLAELAVHINSAVNRDPGQHVFFLDFQRMASGTQKHLHTAALQSLQCRGYTGRHLMPAHGNQRAVHIKEGGAYPFPAARCQCRQLGKAVDMQLRRTLVKRESFVPQGSHNAARRRTCLYTVGGVLHDQTFLWPAP